MNEQSRKNEFKTESCISQIQTKAKYKHLVNSNWIYFSFVAHDQVKNHQTNHRATTTETINPNTHTTLTQKCNFFLLKCNDSLTLLCSSSIYYVISHLRFIVFWPLFFHQFDIFNLCARRAIRLIYKYISRNSEKKKKKKKIK